MHEPMAALYGRRPHSPRGGFHLAVGLLLGGLLGATAGLMVGASKYTASHVPVGEAGRQLPAEQPQLFADSGGGSADDDCASDPRVAWPLLGLVAGLMFGVSAAQGYDQLRRPRWDVDE